jgi:penicillin-binding protein 1A
MTKRGRPTATQAGGSLIGRLFKWLFVLGLWGVLTVGVLLAWYARELPGLIENPRFERKASITVLANDGSVIGRYGDIKGESLAIQDMPKHLVDAILATEDRRFYSHFGIDPIGLTRAIIVNVMHKGTVQGGSTITQQLAKNLFLSQEKTYKRKIQEALLALWLEHELTKDEILSAYMNRVYLGAGTYGVEAAAKVYFGKKVKDLPLHESAILAGLLKAPSRYSPIANPKASEERAKVVLSAMVDAGFITEKKAKAAKANKLARSDDGPEGEASRYFADWIVDSLENVIGTPTEDIVVETTLDPEVEESTARVLKDSVEKNGKKLKVSQGASVVLRPDGSIVALVGGIDYSKSQFNRATQGLRQPGSSFKPVVYLAAIEAGADEYFMVEDAPITEGRYRPQNFGNKYYGEITMIEAMTWSLNTVAYRLAKMVGIENVIGVARRLGITADLEPNLSLALGTSEVPMIEMAQAYATIASGGFAVKAYGITKVKTEKSNKVLYEREPEESPRVFRGSNIQTLVNMMMSVVQNGTGQAAKGGFFAAGKTGTSQDYRDAWFDGFTDNYTAIVWFGNDDNTSMKSVTGGGLSAGAWRDIIAGAKSDPTPSKYKLLKSYDISNEFGDLLGQILSTAPSNLQENGGNAPSSPSPRFTPDRPGDNVGYRRLND